MKYEAGIHDVKKFVIYSSDAPSYIKVVLSPAELDALLLAAVAHLRKNGRDVTLTERFPESEVDGE